MRQPIQRQGRRAERRRLADPAQRDGGPRRDVVDVGAGRLADLLLPIGLGIDGRPDIGDQVFVVSAEHFDQALFLAGELLVEGALRGARVPDDVGDGGVAIPAFTDRCGQPVEQPVAEGGRVDGRRMRPCRALSSFRLLKTLAHAWYQAVPYYTNLRYIVVPGNWLGVIHDD